MALGLVADSRLSTHGRGAPIGERSEANQAGGTWPGWGEGRVYWFKGCPRCAGDLYQDYDEWVCFQCGGRTYPGGPAQLVLRQSHKRKREVSTINVTIDANRRSERHWQTKHQISIEYFKAGKSVEEVIALTGKGTRQVRGIRERLVDNLVIKS